MAEAIDSQPAEVCISKMAEAIDSQPAEETGQTTEQPKPLTYSEKHWLNVKKMSPRNRSRARNERLRKMLFPKNAVMALNELLREDADEVAIFQVEPCTKYSLTRMYCANLSLKGFTVQGYGDSKSDAKKSAAEQAIKKIYLERLTKVNKAEAEWMVIKEQRQKEREKRLKEWQESQKEREQLIKDGLDAGDETMENAEGPPDLHDEEREERRPDRVTLPMVQVTSLALYKLYASWEKDGCAVPNFHSSEIKSQKGLKKSKGKKAAKRRQLPLNAATLHPGFLLYYMLPGIEYKDVAIEGQKSQQVSFVVSVEAEGKCYVGKASSKKEARRQAALAACQELFHVKFDDNPSSNHPVWAEEATDSKKAKMPQPME